MLKRSLLLTLSVLASLLLTSCTVSVASSTDNGSTTGDGGHAITVVTSTVQLADFTAQIGGGRVSVESLIPAGASTHDYDPAPRALLLLARSDALIINGAGLESFVDSASAAAGFDGLVIDASAGLSSPLEPAEHAHDEHDHDGHSHGAVNPHIWTSPRLAAEMAQEIAKRLAELDPAGAKEYATAYAEYAEKLTALDEWNAANFARVPENERVLITSHDSLHYYLADYDISFAGALVASLEDNAEPSVKELDRLLEEIRERKIRAIFLETTTSPKLAEALAADSEANVISENRLAVEDLGTAATYIGATVNNTRTILAAWGYDPLPLPKELENAV